MRRPALPRPALVVTLCLTFVGALSWSARAQTGDPAFRSEVERLMDLTGAPALGAQAATLAFDQMLRDLTQSQPNVSDRALAAVRDVLADELSKAFAAPEMRERQVEVFVEHFTRDEVRALLVFYDTAVGRKASAMLPVMLHAAMVAGREWIATNEERIGALIEARFKADGVIR